MRSESTVFLGQPRLMNAKVGALRPGTFSLIEHLTGDSAVNGRPDAGPRRRSSGGGDVFGPFYAERSRASNAGRPAAAGFGAGKARVGTRHQPPRLRGCVHELYTRPGAGVKLGGMCRRK